MRVGAGVHREGWAQGRHRQYWLGSAASSAAATPGIEATATATRSRPTTAGSVAACSLGSLQSQKGAVMMTVETDECDAVTFDANVHEFAGLDARNPTATSITAVGSVGIRTLST